MRSLRLEGGSSPPAVDNAPALLLRASGAGGPIAYSVSDLVTTGGMKGGVSADGIVVNDGGTGRFVRTSIADTAARYLGAAGINVLGANVSAAIARTTLIPLATQKQVALLLGGGASATMAESTVSDNFPTTGISVADPGSSVGLVRSTVRVQGLPLLVANDAAGTTQAIALDSELADINPVGAFPEAVLLRNTAIAAGAHITFTARGSTLVSRGAPPANGTLGGLLLVGASVPGSTVDATLQNSVVRAERTDGDPAHFDVGAANLGVGDAGPLELHGRLHPGRRCGDAAGYSRGRDRQPRVRGGRVRQLLAVGGLAVGGSRGSGARRAQRARPRRGAAIGRRGRGLRCGAGHRARAAGCKAEISPARRPTGF